MKSKLCMLLATLLLFSSLASCGQAAPTATEQATTAATSAAATAAANTDAETVDSGANNDSDNASDNASEPVGGDDGDMTPITFDWFVPDPSHKIPPDGAPVMQQVFEKTGVKFNRLIPPAEPEERLNIMLASDDMPDLITFNESNATIMKQYIAANKLLKLNDLMEKYAPNTFNMNWEMDVKDKIVDANGDYWFIPAGYTFGDFSAEADHSFNARTDYFDEFAYKDTKTIEDFAQLVRDAHEWNPDIVPLGLALGPQGHLDGILTVAAATYGLCYERSHVSYILDKAKDELIYYTQSPEIKSFMKYLNGLNIEGLVDPESPIMSHEMLKQKVVGEQVWSWVGPWWEIGTEMWAYEESIGSQDQMTFLFPVADESLEYGTYAPYTINMYSTGLTLTTKCKDPERFIKFYEFANTTEGWLTLQGIINREFTGENTIEATDGYDYIIRSDYLVDGKPAFTASAWMGEMWDSDENWYWNRGVERMGNFTYSLDSVHPDSWFVRQPSDVSVWWDENTTRVRNELGWTGVNYTVRMNDMGVDTSAIAGLILDPDWNEYIQWQAIRKLHEDTLPRIIMASSEAEFEAEWEKYSAELDKQGISDVMSKYNELYRERMDNWAAAD